jgi:hypothetical protein
MLAGLFLNGGSVFAAAKTRVSGTVRDGSGNGLAHAFVEAIPVVENRGGGTASDFPNPWVAADSSGAFSLGLASGRYRFRAKDEADGFPDPSFWLNFDPKARFPEILVRDKETRDVQIVLGTQGGILAGEVDDARTRRPLAGAKIRIQDAGNTGAYVEVFADRAGRFQCTVPSKPVLISAVTPGYKPAAFERGTALLISRGERHEVDLELEPD